MRGQIGYLLADVERLKREGKVPSDYNPFPPKATLIILSVSTVLVAFIYGATVLASNLLS
jgi:hypothetical protein